MRGMTGVEVAKKLKEINPKMNIIFVTGFSDYKGDAMDMKASGYIMKPVTAEEVKAELDAGAVNSYQNEYMSQYYWADFLFDEDLY